MGATASTDRAAHTGIAARLIGDPIARAVEAARSSAAVPDGAIIGQPASAGRATGPIHLITGPEDFAGFVDGEVLLAKATAPAWTPLFARAAAIVTDSGTLAAHASLLAREYGIPRRGRHRGRHPPAAPRATRHCRRRRRHRHPPRPAHVPPLRAAAVLEVFLIVHIAAGVIAVLTGAAAMLAPKTPGRHPRRGTAYLATHHACRHRRRPGRSGLAARHPPARPRRHRARAGRPRLHRPQGPPGRLAALAHHRHGRLLHPYPHRVLRRQRPEPAAMEPAPPDQLLVPSRRRRHPAAPRPAPARPTHPAGGWDDTTDGYCDTGLTRSLRRHGQDPWTSLPPAPARRTSTRRSAFYHKRPSTRDPASPSARRLFPQVEVSHNRTTQSTPRNTNAGPVSIGCRVWRTRSGTRGCRPRIRTRSCSSTRSPPRTA